MADELQRRAVHASGTGFPLVYLLGILSWRQLQLFLLAVLMIVMLLEFLRLVVGLDHAIYDRLTREYEQENVAGYALFVVSVTAVALVFPPPVAVSGMLMLSIGDPVAGLLSEADPTTAKQVGVLATMFLICFVLAVLVLFGVEAISRPVALAAGATGALGATVADGFKPVINGYVIDDNLTIPPLGCLGITAVFLVTGAAV